MDISPFLVKYSGDLFQPECPLGRAVEDNDGEVGGRGGRGEGRALASHPRPPRHHLESSRREKQNQTWLSKYWRKKEKILKKSNKIYSF